ncbi:hypothetical protein [Streptomyces sp. NPDC057596]|uniref:hypothetical protein n=1 Tax=Streptomyces sp. NPDC057596 TaxID=3346178 RepID=UPI0036939E06
MGGRAEGTGSRRRIGRLTGRRQERDRLTLLTIALGTVNAIDNLTRQTLVPEWSGRTSARSGQLQQRDDQRRPVTGRLVDDDDE